MSDTIIPALAPLVRGLYLEELGRPVALVSSPAVAAAPRDALVVDVGAGLGAAPTGPAGSTARERSAAEALRTALESWRLAPDRAGLLPGCVVAAEGGARVAFWPGIGRDEAARRAASSDGSPWRASESAAVAAALRESMAGLPSAGAAASARAAALGAGARSSVVEGRIALVTGGAQGFGEEIVRGLAASGALVFAADLNLEGAARLAEGINAAAGRTAVLPLSIDVSDEASVAAAFDAAAAAAGGLDLVVSNAGVLRAGSVLEQDDRTFRFVTEVNYIGFFHVAKHAGLLMRRQRASAARWATDIIQVNSKSGLEGSNKNGAYAGSKFGGIGLVQSFALELVEHGIKVNAVCPGNFFDGPLWSDPANGLFVQYLRSGKVPGARTVEEVKAFYEAKVPMGRGCEGRDVMRAIFYLVEQAYETGQALPVTGGQVMLA